MYFPPFSLKKIRGRRANADNGGETVGMSLRTFEKRIAPALGNSFSGDAYFDKYIDIREAAKLGKIASPLVHCDASLRAVRICRMAGA